MATRQSELKLKWDTHKKMQYSDGFVVIAEAWVGHDHGVFMFQGFYIATEEGRGIPLFNGLPIASIKKKDEINLVYSLSSA